MSENDPNEGTTPETPEAPAATPSTPATPDEVTTLKSRNAGLDAKVTELTRQAKAAEKTAAEAAQKLADYEAGKVNSDEALRAQLQAAKAETETARREAKVARIEAKYPETFGLFGDDVAGMAEDKLAASEVRLRGAAPVEEPPTPLGSNPSSTSQNRAAKQPTLADVEAEMGRQFPDWNSVN